MKKKCPKCGASAKGALVPKYSGSEKALAAAAAIGFAIAGTCVAGPIGTFAGSYLGQAMANGLSNGATNTEKVQGWKCNKCGYEWHD